MSQSDAIINYQSFGPCAIVLSIQVFNDSVQLIFVQLTKSVLNCSSHDNFKYTCNLKDLMDCNIPIPSLPRQSTQNHFYHIQVLFHWTILAGLTLTLTLPKV